MKTKITSCKTIKTYDKDGRENGSIIELLKDGDKTLVYITTIKPGTFKGYHIHKRRTNRWVCIKGVLEIEIYDPTNQKQLKLTLDSEYPEMVSIEPNQAIGIENQSTTDAWLINFPDPPFDPNDKNEQSNFEKRGKYEKNIR